MKQKKSYAGVLVNYNNKFLLCKRNNLGSYPGMWSIPGGKMEEGESPEESAKREFYEETNISIDDANLKYIDSIPRHTRDGKKVKGFMHVFGIDVVNKIYPDLENAIDGEEHTESDYFTLKQIDETMCGTELYNLIKKYLTSEKKVVSL